MVGASLAGSPDLICTKNVNLTNAVEEGNRGWPNNAQLKLHTKHELHGIKILHDPIFALLVDRWDHQQHSNAREINILISSAKIFPIPMTLSD